LTPIFDDEKQLRGFAKIARDMTERKEAEEAVREAAVRLKAIVDTAVDGIITIDEHGTVESMNPAAERIFGFSSQEVLGCNITMLMPEAESPAHGQDLESYLRSGEPKIMGTIREVRGRRKDGSTFPMDLAASETRLGTRRIFTGMIRDITEFKEAVTALKDADARKDQFLAMLAHELRNPLAPICNAMRLLRMGDVSTATAKQYDIIDRQLEDLVRLVDDLLDVGRITRGDIVLKKQVVDLVDIVHQVVEQTRQQIDEKKQQLDLSLPATPLRIDGDPIRLKQVISNLLSNAAKYTDPGGRIALTIERQDRAALLRVHDTGIGMDSETLHHVFELFYQADTAFSRTRGGLGVGLTLVRRLVELHGGRIDAYSEGLGKGSEFTVRLPLISAAVESVEMPRTEPPPVPSGGRRILIVDDNADTAETVALLVQSWGYKTAIANDATAAIEVTKSFRPDIALLDIGLPRMNGFELARSLRKLPESAKILLIAITGYGREQDREAAHLAGFNHYMVKPVAVDRLQALLASFD
jgi:PAS domain S-box-containing protein